MDESTFPIHMNLAFRPLLDHGGLGAEAQAVRRLRDQNRLLTDEVAKKDDLISKLEEEKTALVRELSYQPRPAAHVQERDQPPFVPVAM